MITDLNGSFVLMTGATSGFGKVAVCELANKGAHVFVLCRSEKKGALLKKYFHDNYRTGKGIMEIVTCNLNSFSSISIACNKLKSKLLKLDTIIHNAGIINFEFKETENRIEETFQVNLLAPILISHFFIDLLVQSPKAKLIFTASDIHEGVINFGDIEFREKFSSYNSYRQSKLGIILICKYLSQKFSKTNIGFYCQHPGTVRTNILDRAKWFSRVIFYLKGVSPKVGTKTLIYLVEKSKDDLRSGEYYSNCKVTTTTKESYDIFIAEKLFCLIQKYLSNYIQEPSLLFH